MSGYPVQASKVQRPPLRDETLARDRLLDWLHAKIHHRAVFVIAEAGYGKTTLLADFSRRTRLRTLWYRLDDADRHWVAFLSHLAAAGREHDETFAAATSGLLREMAGAGPTLETVLETFAREVQVLGEAGAVFILDDYHLVEDAPDVRTIMRTLLARAPERVSFVIASRRVPALSIARLRAQGEVAELSTDDLRFSEAETEQLFRETYGRPLEPDVLSDLTRRTEGWAASLQLVQAALQGRSAAEIRASVRNLSGAAGDLYDYLAEEVIGSLSPELQRFVMVCSLLDDVEPEVAAAACDISVDDAARLTDEAVRAGLLAHRARRLSRTRFHPLVREFLNARLRAEIGPAGIVALHRRIAEFSRDRDWRLAARHYLQSDDQFEVEDLLVRSLTVIASQGAYEEARRILADADRASSSAARWIFDARSEIQRGRLDLAIRYAGQAVDTAGPGSDELAIALATLVAVTVNAGDSQRARSYAAQLLTATNDASLVAIADATIRLLDASEEGDLNDYRAALEAMAGRQRDRGQLHYFGVTMLNLADTLRVQGRFAEALECAGDAIDALSRSSAGMELAMAHAVRAWAVAHVRGIEQATEDVAAALAFDSPVWRLQFLHEIADLTGFYGDPQRALELLDGSGDAEALPPSVAAPLVAARARALLRVGRGDEAPELVAATGEVIVSPGFAASIATTDALLQTATDRSNAPQAFRRAIDIGRKQNADLWLTIGTVAQACVGSPGQFARTIEPILNNQPSYASMLAELVVPRLDLLRANEFEALAKEVRFRPSRWRAALRRSVDGTNRPAVAAGWLLEEVGESEDVLRLRNLARRFRQASGISGLGRGLARKLADRVHVEDLGRVTIMIGGRPVPAPSIRRKVLALVCFLLVQRDLSATRDQILDALWPDLDPGQALNSLNQTLYFLRRVIEPSYQETVSPGYVHHESEVVWLDRELIGSTSSACRDLIRSLPPEPTPSQVEALSDSYTARFALDFEYEEWAREYRDWLHSAYLETIERAVKSDTNSGHYSRGIRLAQRALEVDPYAEQIEVSLLRLYRLSGAHSAAAEQYAHYAHSVRTNLGIEPPALEAL